MSKVKGVLDELLKMFESGDVPQAVAVSMFPPIEVPSNKWSILNRTLQMINGTADARGFRQWQEVNRYVKKGSKALYILVPMIFKKEDEDGERQVLGGFKACPVFRVEDTDGEELEYNLLELPEFPFKERAEQWGISVRAIPGNFKYYGYYSKSQQHIALASKDESVFFHELSHAADDRLHDIKGGQDPIQEIVAEFSAQVLCHLVGKKDSTGNSYRYISKYAKDLKLSPHQACLKVLTRTEKVINLIMEDENEAH